MAKLKELGQIPPEEHLIRAIENAKLMLDCGFTSLYSAASCKWRTEIALRDAINAGKIVGPRLRAASPEIVSTGGWATSRNCTCRTRASRSSPTAPMKSAKSYAR